MRGITALAAVCRSGISAGRTPASVRPRHDPITAITICTLSVVFLVFKVSTVSNTVTSE